MASKSVPFVMIGKESGRIISTGAARKEVIQRLNNGTHKKYSPSLRRREVVTVKPVKKGGTKALANAK